MGKNLVKTPLLAVIFAAIFHFVLVFIPWSEGYAQMLEEFPASLAGYLVPMGHGLFLSLVFALLFHATPAKGIKFFLFSLLGCLGLQWVLPLTQQVLFGETTGVMQQMDTLLWLAIGCVCTIFLFVLAVLLFPRNDPALPEAGSKAHPAVPQYMLKPLPMLIRVVVLPVIFCIVYFLLTYYLLWKLEPVRVFYSGGEDAGFIAEMIDMLLTNARLVPMVLLKGFLCVLFSFPLMLLLQEKKLMYMVINTLFTVSGSLLLLMPSPLMPDAIRMDHMIAYLAIYLPYGAFTAFFLHSGLGKTAPAPQPAAPPATAPARTATRAAAARR